jgi:type II restriction enzyme
MTLARAMIKQSSMILSLQCSTACPEPYFSSTQRVRVITEGWCAENLYCVACDADTLQQVPVNTRVIDFRCRRCDESYQVKGQKKHQVSRVVDGAYSTMLHAVQQNSAPNLLLLNYSADWLVDNLMLVPSLFFTESVLEKRKPLGPLARRAGWTGCNLLLGNVPEDGRIGMIVSRTIVSPDLVRGQFRKIKKLASLDWSARGWTMDVLKLVRDNLSEQFSLSDVYSFEQQLSKLHPQNKNIRPKIRQQLQVLRDLGFIEFKGGGTYLLVSSNAR